MNEVARPFIGPFRPFIRPFIYLVLGGAHIVLSLLPKGLVKQLSFTTDTMGGI